MTEIIAMSQKELSRARTLALVAEGHVSLAEAAESMGVSERQACRLLGRFKEAGASGLALSLHRSLRYAKRHLASARGEGGSWDP